MEWNDDDDGALDFLMAGWMAVRMRLKERKKPPQSQLTSIYRSIDRSTSQFMQTAAGSSITHAHPKPTRGLSWMDTLVGYGEAKNARTAHAGASQVWLVTVLKEDGNQYKPNTGPHHLPRLLLHILSSSSFFLFMFLSLSISDALHLLPFTTNKHPALPRQRQRTSQSCFVNTTDSPPTP
jgi:hypothetical protein